MTQLDLKARTLAAVLADFSRGLSVDEVPEEVRRSAKLRTLDILGVSLAARATSGAAAMERVVLDRGGRAEAGIVGSSARVPASGAALLNGHLAHALDFDDTHHEARVHASCVVIPAMLAAAEANGSTGQEALAAAIAGLELVVRIGLAAPGQYHERGWHATSVCGAVAAAALAGRLYGLDAEQLVHAIGISTSTASGLREAYLGQGTDTKAMHSGWAAQAGISAAELARYGFTGAATALEGRFGYFNAFLAPAPWDLEGRLASLGSEWLTPEITYKLFPCGSLAHGCIDAALELHRHPGFDPAEVRDVACILPAGMVSTIAEPANVKLNPRSGYEAKFSVQYAVAAALVRGRVTEEEYQAAALEDPKLRSMLAKVRYEVDESLPFPAKYPGGVRVSLNDGERLEVFRANSPGTPERPIRDEEIVEKFHANAAGSPAAARAAEIVERVMNLESEPGLSPILELCAGTSE